MNLLKFLEFISRKQGEVIKKDLFESLHSHQKSKDNFDYAHMVVTYIVAFGTWCNYLDIKSLRNNIERHKDYTNERFIRNIR